MNSILFAKLTRIVSNAQGELSLSQPFLKCIFCQVTNIHLDGNLVTCVSVNLSNTNFQSTKVATHDASQMQEAANEHFVNAIVNLLSIMLLQLAFIPMIFMLSGHQTDGIQKVNA